MPNAETFGITAGLITLAAFVPYVLGTFSCGFTWRYPFLKKIPMTRANRATWWIWSVVGWLSLGFYTDVGAEETLWLAYALVMGPTTVAILSFWRGEGGWTWFDKCCLIGAATSVTVWLITNASDLGLVLALAADGFGVAATIRHAWRKPEEESHFGWALFLFGDAVNMLAVTEWSFAGWSIWIYPVYMIAHSVPITALVVFTWRPQLWRRKGHAHKASFPAE